MFRVRWERQALDELTSIWTMAGSAGRAAITAATAVLDQRLRSNGPNEGESRAGRRRVLFVPPLAVTYRVEEDGHTVSVLQVRPMRRLAP
jgi:plasmid stabilization system protein ParE